jgi:diguanylate cyclase (GGDEF)-like protein
MNITLTRKNVWTVAVRNYWWLSTVGGMYFVVGFWLWHGSRAAILSSMWFLVVAIVGLVLHYLPSWHRRLPQVCMIMAHLLLGQAILIWQKSHLPLSDYTHLGNPASRDLLIYLVSTLIMGAMSMFAGAWGAVIALATHYAFIFNIHDEFSFKWIFPVFMVMAGGIVSTAFWRLDRAYDQLEVLANRDNLTGLLNRHRLVAEFDRLHALAREKGRPLLLVAWDLDGLKEINDQQGHAAGDDHIRNFANALQANVRHPSDARFGDAAFRVGGDEFISMHLDARDGENLMERVHQSCPSVSAGWVLCNSLTLDQSLTRADKALYDSKERRKKGLPRAAACD